MGLSVNTLNLYLAFKAYPKRPETREKIERYFRLPIGMLFPDDIRDLRIERQPDAISFTREEALEMGLVGGFGHDLEDATEHQALMERIEQALGKLTDLEARVLTMRYGLEGSLRAGPMTCVEVGREFGVTGGRINQIELKALRKLRHPNRGKALRGVSTLPALPTRPVYKDGRIDYYEIQEKCADCPDRRWVRLAPADVNEHQYICEDCQAPKVRHGRNTWLYPHPPRATPM